MAGWERPGQDGRDEEEHEYEGLDLTQHGESGYNFEEVFPGTVLEDGGPTR